MAELDYAYLADYARIGSSGTLTAVNASYTFLRTTELPLQHRMSIAGRIRGSADEPSIALKVTLTGPEGTPVVSGGTDIKIGPNTKPYRDGVIGHLWAMDVNVLLVEPGMYWASVEVDGVEVRRLGFEVLLEPDPA